MLQLEREWEMGACQIVSLSGQMNNKISQTQFKIGMNDVCDTIVNNSDMQINIYDYYSNKPGIFSYYKN